MDLTSIVGVTMTARSPVRFPDASKKMYRPSFGMRRKKHLNVQRNNSLENSLNEL